MADMDEALLEREMFEVWNESRILISHHFRMKKNAGTEKIFIDKGGTLKYWS